MIQKFQIQFMLHTHRCSSKEIKNAFAEFGEHLLIEELVSANEEENNFQVSLVSEEPTAIFDICGQFGRIRAVKVEEIQSS
jgi:dihydroxyacetone kinase-like predicted kinase